jgi:hypothetical protein
MLPAAQSQINPLLLIPQILLHIGHHLLYRHKTLFLEAFEALCGFLVGLLRESILVSPGIVMTFEVEEILGRKGIKLSE